MKIMVRAFASFREILGKEIEMDLKEGSTVRDLLETLASSSPKLKKAAFDDSGNLLEYVLLMTNRKRIDPSDLDGAVLKDGDEVAIFPPVAGG
ncbi:MAG: MoaD/ThiS family protein [Methanotrichaceae archaeon]|nr:MoaD/ThiS family protein [Methanotrichaceae archaeon]